MSELEHSHLISIEQLEYQMGQLSRTFYQQKSGTLPNDTIKNLRNDKSCMAINTKSGKFLPKKYLMHQKYVYDVASNYEMVDHDVYVWKKQAKSKKLENIN